MNENNTICPRCGTPSLRPEQALNALSRKDNRTYVCSSCGRDEGMRDMFGDDVWPEYPKALRFDH